MFAAWAIEEHESPETTTCVTLQSWPAKPRHSFCHAIPGMSEVWKVKVTWAYLPGNEIGAVGVNGVGVRSD